MTTAPTSTLTTWPHAITLRAGSVVRFKPFGREYEGRVTALSHGTGGMPTQTIDLVPESVTEAISGDSAQDWPWPSLITVRLCEVTAVLSPEGEWVSTNALPHTPRTSLVPSA